MAQFEGYERREAKILATLKEYGISSIDECKEICDKAGIDPYTIVQETQPICFENAKWAYTVGAADEFFLLCADNFRRGLFLCSDIINFNKSPLIAVSFRLLLVLGDLTARKALISACGDNLTARYQFGAEE